MLTAKERKCGEIMIDFIKDVRCKICPLIVTTIISLVISLAIVNSEMLNTDTLCKLINSLSKANLTMLGIDIAALAILYAFFLNEDMDENAKKAFREQNISFVGNAFLQITAFLLSVLYIVYSTDTITFVTLFIQILALALVFDLIIELYTLHTLITNKKNRT